MKKELKSYLQKSVEKNKRRADYYENLVNQGKDTDGKFELMENMLREREKTYQDVLSMIDSLEEYERLGVL